MRVEARMQTPEQLFFRSLIRGGFEATSKNDDKDSYYVIIGWLDNLVVVSRGRWRPEYCQAVFNELTQVTVEKQVGRLSDTKILGRAARLVRARPLLTC